jgi:flagellar motor switch protein FliM
MDKNLGQEEIDALFAAANTSAKQNQTLDREPEPYDFKRAGQISNDQMRAISTVNDLFSRNLMQTLGGWLRSPLKIKLVSGEQLSFGEFLERMTLSNYICSVRLEPLGAVGLIDLDLSLAHHIIDILLGGTGEVSLTRELTEIEEVILMSVMEVVIQELNLAWQSVGLSFTFEKRETHAQASRTLVSGEKTLCVSFELRLPAGQGGFNLCLPAVVLNAILRKLITEKDRPRRRSKATEVRVRELMMKARFGAVLQFPPVRLRTSELNTLEPGAILRLPLPRYEAAELTIGGLHFARARLVRSGEHRAALLEDRANQNPKVNLGKERDGDKNGSRD